MRSASISGGVHLGVPPLGTVAPGTVIIVMSSARGGGSPSGNSSGKRGLKCLTSAATAGLTRFVEASSNQVSTFVYVTVLVLVELGIGS